MPQTTQGLLLDLPHPLARDAELQADFLEGERLVLVEAEIHAENACLALLQLVQGALDGLHHRMLDHLLLGRRVLGVGEVIAEAVVLAGRHGSVQRHVPLCDAHGQRHFVHGNGHVPGDLVMGGFPAKLLHHGAGPLADPIQRTGAIERYAHDTALLGQRLQDGLANPPDGVGDELDLLRLVELLRGADQAEVALVDEVGKGDPLILVPLRDRHDESQIGADERIEGFAIVIADAAGQFRLAFTRDQGIPADILQVLIQ